MQKRITPAVMRIRPSIVEHPFATIKYRTFGILGLSGARVEIGLATMAYNIKRIQTWLAQCNSQKPSVVLEQVAISAFHRSGTHFAESCCSSSLF
jgi:hypothetical protein